MNIKKGDKVTLKSDCMIGRKGEVWVIEDVDEDYVETSRGHFSYVTMSLNVFKRYFEIKEEKVAKVKKATCDDESKSSVLVDKKFTFDCKGEIANKVSAERVDAIIDKSDIVVDTIWDKCTVVSCKLPNGFIINESSACVDPENYDEELGYKICMKRIKDKVWELEGYLLAEKLNSNNDYCYDEDDCVDDCRYCADYNECCFR